MRSFTDAAADAVARCIADLQKEARHQRELRESEHRAVMAEINVHLQSVAALERQLTNRLVQLKDGQDGKSVSLDDVSPLVVAECERLFAGLPLPEKGEPGEPGKDADADLISRLVDEKLSEAVAALPPAAPGKDADPEVIERMVRDAVAALPPAEPGKDADPKLVADLVDEKVCKAVEALPPPAKGEPGEPGKDADEEAIFNRVVAECKSGLPELVALAVASSAKELRGPPGDPGKDGAPGQLPMAKEWSDRVFYESQVATHNGGLYQALKDTAKEPPHEDWICLARPGKDADEIEVMSTYDGTTDYKRLNIVALNGAGFMARKDNPGPCPGEDWQMIAMQGKQGKQGKPGAPGQKGSPGLAVTASVTKVEINDDGLLTLTNANGATVECDLYPVLSRIGS